MPQAYLIPADIQVEKLFVQAGTIVFEGTETELIMILRQIYTVRTSERHHHSEVWLTRIMDYHFTPEKTDYLMSILRGASHDARTRARCDFLTQRSRFTGLEPELQIKIASYYAEMRFLNETIVDVFATYATMKEFNDFLRILDGTRSNGHKPKAQLLCHMFDTLEKLFDGKAPEQLRKLCALMHFPEMNKLRGPRFQRIAGILTNTGCSEIITNSGLVY